MSVPAKKVVLVADDDPDILDLVEFRLDQAGFEVIAAKDGQQALDLATTRNPDLCVLDVMMPRIDGYEVTRRLRAAEATRDLPVILLTARAQEKDVETGFQAGANDYIRKPFSPEELWARVRANVRG
jgi:DNA-binding response OmpR family regulator